ncbi:MAG: EF-P lysine aminoacylase GenX [Deltaproteobacteria bacterium HGW-Deltaproteobacteria-10]|nr:MAG: EF-P lysine aminoacylase GenX [Deltaproteobacteria bacterium HGW-Deltaproteobacteria-10]
MLARKRNALQLRASLIQNIRLFFINNNFLEIETPIRIPAPAPEEHIEALPSGDWFLQTSPELCMKRLLAADYPQIFQISKCFRDSERGKLHLPEFTMLEWYVAGFDYQQLMNQCAEMIVSSANALGFENILPWQHSSINLSSPWERITVQEAFNKYAPVTLAEALNRGNFDEILTEHIEPKLGMARPTFLYDYPAQMGALARLKQIDKSVAERFELYIGGLELANGFSELTDAREQRDRFMEAQSIRAKKDYAAYPLPEKFLSALDDLPASAGVALGIDRLAMLFTGAAGIDDVVAFPPEML